MPYTILLSWIINNYNSYKNNNNNNNNNINGLNNIHQIARIFRIYIFILKKKLSFSSNNFCFHYHRHTIVIIIIINSVEINSIQYSILMHSETDYTATHHHHHRHLSFEHIAWKNHFICLWLFMNLCKYISQPSIIQTLLNHLYHYVVFQPKLVMNLANCSDLFTNVVNFIANILEKHV